MRGGQRLMLRGIRKQPRPQASRSMIGTWVRPNSHESRRNRLLSFELSGLPGYDDGLRFDRWEVSVDKATTIARASPLPRITDGNCWRLQ